MQIAEIVKITTILLVLAKKKILTRSCKRIVFEVLGELYGKQYSFILLGFLENTPSKQRCINHIYRRVVKYSNNANENCFAASMR
jgi:hypothetical protein